MRARVCGKLDQGLTLPLKISPFSGQRLQPREHKYVGKLHSSSPVAEMRNGFVTQRPTDEQLDHSGEPEKMKVASLGSTAC